MLTAVKLLHTLVWAIMAAAVFYVLFCGLTGAGGRLLWLSVGLILLETAVLLFNGWRCPLTGMAALYTSPSGDNFDIYLPAWLARHNKTIFGGLFLLGLALVAVRKF